jgi:predicted porin
MWSPFAAAGNWLGDFGAHPHDNDNADWDYRIQNSVKYVSPAYGGFKGEVLYGSRIRRAASPATASTAPRCSTRPVFSAAVAYLKANNGGATAAGALSSDDTVFSGRSQQNIDVGASYKFNDKLTLSAAYSHVDVYGPEANVYFTNQPATGSQNAWKFDNFEVNGQYFLLPDVCLAPPTPIRTRVATAAGDASPSWHQPSMMLDYDLSKRTSTYIQGAYQHATGNTGTDFDHARARHRRTVVGPQPARVAHRDDASLLTCARRDGGRALRVPAVARRTVRTGGAGPRGPRSGSTPTPRRRARPRPSAPYALSCPRANTAYRPVRFDSE